MKITCLIFLIIIPLISSLNQGIDCNLNKTENLAELAKFNSICDVRNFTYFEKNSNNITIENVEALRFTNNSVPTIPRGIHNHFKNLKALVIVKSNLVKISSTDLQKLTHLEFLNLNYNNIEFLERYLFQFNTNLEIILIKNNRIKFVHPHAFRDLEKLHNLDFQSNHCLNSSVKNDTTHIKSLLDEIEKKCWREPLEVITNMSILDISASKVIFGEFNETLQHKLGNMSNQINIIEFSMKNQSINNNNNNIVNYFSDFYTSLTNGKANINELITLLNSVVLLIIIIMLFLAFICKRKPKSKPKKLQSIKIEHVTHDDFSINKYEQVVQPINSTNDEPKIEIEEELYSEINAYNMKEIEENVELDAGDSPIYAQVQKNND